jgi:hypothetical protein
MVTYNPKPHTLFLVPKLNIPAREFSMVQRELEGALARLGDCREPRRRVQILRELRALIEEADRAVVSSSDLKPELKVLPRNRG